MSSFSVCSRCARFASRVCRTLAPPACLVLAFTLATASPTRAADIVFQQSVLDGTNYDWSNPANWVGGVLPGIGDRADIAFGDTATLNVGSTNLVNSFFLGADNAPALSGDGFTGSASTTGNGTLNQSAGTLVIVNSGFLGYASGSIGTYNLSGIGVLTGSSLTVGQSGTGIFNVGNSTTVSLTNLALGNSTGGHGTVTQSGTTNVFVGNTLTVAGGTSSTGSYTLNAGNLQFTNNLNIATNTGSIGSMTVTGGIVNGGGVNMATGDSSQATLSLSGASIFNTTGNVNVGTQNNAGGTTTIATITQIGSAALNVNNGQSLNIGTGNGNQPLVATYSMSGGTTNIGSNFNVGSNHNTTGVFNLSGTSSAVTVGSSFIIGQNGGTGAVNQTAGTITYGLNGWNPAGLIIGTGNQNGTNGNGTYTISGGTLNEVVVTPNNNGWTNANYIGNNGGTGTLNVNGGTINFATSGAVDISGAQGSGSTGTVNLNAGVMAAPNVTGGNGASTLNFNGGTLRAIVNNTSFLTGVNNTYVNGAFGTFAGGATLDSNSHTVTIGEVLAAPAGNGITSIALSGNGAGYLVAPTVTISGGGGSGATAIANISSGGVLTGITITNPGVNYSGTPTVTLSGGSPTTAATIGTITTLANVSGGLTVVDSSGSGLGVVTLSAANTFSGPTAVNSGTLNLANALALQNSTLTTGGITFDQSVTGSPPTFTVGGLSGSGNLVLQNNASSPVAVTLNVGNSNTPTTFSGGTSGSGTLAKIGTGTFTLNNTSSLNAATQVNVGTLRITGSVGGAGTITVGGSGASLTPVTLIGPTLTGIGGGTITAPVVINGANGGAAGILAPSAGGTAPITMTFANNLTLNAGAILNLTLSNSLTSGNDQVLMTGSNVLSLGATGTVNITDNNGLAAGNYVLISNSGGAITGGAGWTPVISNPSGGQTYVLGPQGTNFDLTVINNTTNPSITWSGAAGSGGNGIWDIGTTANWVAPSATPVNTFANGNLVTFADTYPPSSTPVANSNITVNGTVTPSLMTFTNKTVAYTFNDGTSAAIAGTGSAVISGGGIVTFQNTNTFTGGTSVTGGSTLNIGGNIGFIPPAGSYASSVIAVSGAGSKFNVGVNGTLTATGGVYPSLVLGNGGAATFNSNASQSIGGLNGDSTSSLTLNMQPGFTLNVTEGGTMGGLVTGSSSLTVSGGNLVLTNGGNTFSGGTTITGGGTLTINNDGSATGTNTPLGAIPASSSNSLLVVNGGTLAANATFSLNANRSIQLGSASGSGSGTLGVTSSNVLTVPGAIVDNSGSTGNTLFKTGTGTLVLTGTSNTYSGGTTISGGTLRVGAAANLGAGTITLAGGSAGSTLALSNPGFAINVSGFNNGAGFATNTNGNGPASFSGNTLTITTQNGNQANTAIFTTKVPVNSFVASFVYRDVSTGGNDGATFFIQNNGTTQLGGNGGNMGYGGGGVGNPSLAFGLNLDSGSNQFSINTNGAAPNTNANTVQTNGSGLQIQNGDPIAVTLNYNGTTLNYTLTDLNSPAKTFSGSTAINIPGDTGGTPAFIGFSGGTGGGSALQQFSNFIEYNGASTSPLTLNNALAVTSGSTGTVNFGGFPTASIASLAIGSGSTLNITSPTGTNVTSSGTSFSGSATLNIASGVALTSGPVTGSIGGAGNSLNVAGGGTLTVNQASDSPATFTGAAINITGSSVRTQSSGTVTGLGNASKFNLSSGNLTIAGVPSGAGLVGVFFPLSPGDNSSNWGTYNNGTGPSPNHATNNWPNGNNTGISSAADQAIIAGMGTPIVTQVLPTTANIPVSNAQWSYTYQGGVNFPNSNNNINSFTAIGVDIAGGGTPPTYSGNNGGVGYNSITADWKGTITLANAGTLNLAVNSDDYAAVAIDGTIILARGNGGTGFSNNNTAAGGNLTSIGLTAGTHSIELFYDEGGGGWGIVTGYNFNGTDTNTSSFPFAIGENDSTDGITFNSALAGINLSTPVVASGSSSLTLTSAGTATFTGSPAALTLNNAANLTISGGAPAASFSTTTVSGNATVTANIPVDLGVVSSGGSPTFSSLTMAGTSQLLLDSTANTAFVTGTTIHANAGTAVGVNVGGINSLANPANPSNAATLDVNGGTFSLGSDGHNGSAGDNFANPITLSASGTIIGQQLGAGAVTGSTINLTGGIATGSSAANVLTLNTANNYTLNVASAMTGSGTVNGAGTVNLNVASPTFTGALTVAGGTTTDNAAGALATSGSATVNGGNLTIAAAGETLNHLTVNNGATANLNANGVNLPFATTVNSGGTLRIAGALGSVAPVNVASGATVNIAATGNLGNGVLTLGGTGLLQATALTVVTGAGSLGTGTINLNPSSELRFTGGNGTANNYAGSTINVNSGLVHVATGSANLGTAVITVAPQVFGGINGLTGILYAGLSNGTTSAAAYNNASGNGGVNILSLMQRAVVSGVSASNVRILTAASTPHGDGIDFQSDADMGNWFGNANVASNATGNYTSIFFGHFTAPTTGNYNFAVTGVDDNAAIYYDPNNGTAFTQIASANCCTNTTTQSQGTPGTISLTAGQVIAVAFAQQDGGGGSNFEAGIELAPAPSNNNNNAYTIIGPGASGQAGLWSYSTVTGGGAIQVDASASLAAGGFTAASNVTLANGATMTLSAPSNNFTSSTTQLTVTATTLPATLGFAGSNNHTVNVGTLSIATGGTLNLTNSGTAAGILNLTGAGDPANTGTLSVGMGASLSGTGSTSGSVTVLSGGTVIGNSTASPLTIAGTLTLMSGSILNFTVPGTSNSSPLITVGTLAPPGTGSVVVNIANLTAPAGGVYDLLNYNNGPGNATTAVGFTAGPAPNGFTYTLSTVAPVGATPGQLDLTVTQSFTWTAHPGGTGTGTGVDVWDNATANWASGMPLVAATFPVTGGTAQFGDTNPLGGPNPDGTVNIVAGGVTPVGVNFSNTAVNYTVNDTDSTNGIGGSGGVTLSGGGMVTFTGPNSYTGSTTITNASTLNFSNGNQLGGTSAIVLTGGTLNATGGAPVSLGSSQGVQLGNSSNPGTISTAANTQLTIAGPVSDNSTGGTLRVAGAGTVILTSNSNTFSGTTTINSGSTLQIGNDTGSGTLGSGNVVANGSLVFNQGAFVTVTNNISGASTGNVIVAGNSQIVLNPSTGNTYAGGTIVSNGEILLGGTAPSGNTYLPATTTVTLGNSANTGFGELDLDGNNATVAGLATVGTAANQLITNSGNTSGEVPATLTFAGGATPSTFGGSIQSGSFTTLALTVSSGALHLSGQNFYSGQTTINGGTLFADGPAGNSINGAFSSTGVGNVVVNSGGTLAGNGQALAPGQGSNVTVNSGGTLAGASGGSLKINGAVTMQTSSGLSFTLSDAFRNNTTALIAVNGLLTVSGTSPIPMVTISNTSTLATGDVFEVLSWNSGSVSKSNFTLPTAFDGFALMWSDNTANELDVTVGTQTVTATNGQFTLAVVPGATKVRVSGSTGLTTTLTNTGTGSQDKLFYSALGSSTTTGATVSGGATSLTTPPGLPNSGSSPANVATNAGQSFSASLAGSYIITPSGGTVSNVNDTAEIPVLKSTTAASVSAYDYANPSYTGTVLALGNVRVGDTAPTQNLSVANATVSNAAFQDNLTAGATTNNSAVTATGFSELAAGAAAKNLVFSGNTATAGSLASTATLSLTSTNTVSGLDVKSLTPGGGAVTTTGGVYAFASPTPNTASPVAFGIVHVGATQNVSITNTLTAPTASFQDSLDVTGSGISNLTATGGNILAGVTNPNGLVLTANAVGSLAGTLTIGYNSNHNGIANLSDKTLTSGSIAVTGQANFYAQPTLSQTSGMGTFSHTSATDPVSGTPTNYSLDFGTVSAGTGTFTGNLSVSNHLLSPTFQDLLSGTFTILSGSGDFNLSNLTNFTNLGPGGTLGGPTVSFNSSMAAGSYTEVIQLAPVSHNGSSPDVNLSNIDLTLTGTITGSTSTPPATFTLAATPVSSAGSPIFIHVTGGPGSVVSGGTLSTVLTSTITNTGGAGTDTIVYTGLNLNASGGTLGAPTNLPTSGSVAPTGTTSASGTATFTSNTVGQFTITPTVTSASQQSTSNSVSPSSTSTATVQVNYYAKPTVSLDQGTAGSGSPSGAVVGSTLFLNVAPGSGSSAGLTLSNTTVDSVHPTFQDNLGGTFSSSTTAGVTATPNTINPIASGANQATVATVTYNSTAANNPGNYGSVTLTPTSINSSATATLSNVPLTVTLVSTQQNGLQDYSGGTGGPFGTTASWSVQNNAGLGSANSYAGLESQASTQTSANNTVAKANGFGPFLTTSAQILAGSNSGAFTGNGNATPTMSWRSRTLQETSLGEGGMPAVPPLPSTTSYLISNVLSLGGMSTASGEPVQTDPFVLQMNYNPALVTTGTPYLASLSPGGVWQSAVASNFGGGPDAIGNFMGTFASFLAFEHTHNGLFNDDPTLNPADLSSADLAAILGSSGYDTTNSNVWAVVNHNSQFAAGQFAVVPEPSTLLLAALGLMGMAGYRVRRRRTR